MTLDGLKALIRNTTRNDNFDFAITAIEPILGLAGSWKQDWTTIFQQILKRIKAGKYSPDSKNANGKYALLPITKKEFMVIFFKLPQPHQKKRYLIYDFRIYKKK